MKALDVKEGDKTLWYVVKGKQVTPDGKTVWLTIQYTDGDTGVRETQRRG